MNERHVLLVDDLPEMVALLRHHLEAEGYTVRSAGTGEAALESVRRGFSGVVVLDVMLPDYEGLDLYQELRAINQSLCVIIITAHATVDMAVSAIRAGAFDFISKSEGIIDRLFVVMKNAFERIELFARVESLTTQLAGQRGGIKDILTVASSMTAVLNKLKQVMRTKVSVLIEGESGTGKELVARALHTSSDRGQGPFIALNCAGIPTNLLESELFGSEKGAFTGAVSQRKGMFEQADGGTLFLDEIGEMELSLQAKILRVLQEREFQRLGGTDLVQVNVRIVSATHRDLNKAVDEGEFRQDLYYRLAVFPIELPPLRQRAGDVRLLSHHFAQLFARDEEREVQSFSPEALRSLDEYNYPGNVRELENIVAHACVVCTAGVIQPEHLPAVVSGAGGGSASASRKFAGLLGEAYPLQDNLPKVHEVESELIAYALKMCNGNVSEAARSIGLSRATLYRRVNRVGSG